MANLAVSPLGKFSIPYLLGEDSRTTVINVPLIKRYRLPNGTGVPGPSQFETIQPPNPIQTLQASKPCHDANASNSLMQLSDGCLEKFLTSLNVEDLCIMVDLCFRFRLAAKKVFSQNHREFVFKGVGRKNVVFRRILSKFGELITSIDASEAYFERDEQIDVNAIVKCCHTNLDVLCLRAATIDCDTVRPLFAQLKRIDLDGCKFIGNKNALFNSCRNLETLNFDSIERCDFIVRKFPKLQGISFGVYGHNRPGPFTFLSMMELNPQIKRLCILGVADNLYIMYVLQCLKNVEQLTIWPGTKEIGAEKQDMQGLLQLGKLKKLKKLSFDARHGPYAAYAGPLMDKFVKEHVLIDQLELSGFSINDNDIKSIVNLKTLEVLTLQQVGPIPSDYLVELATKLPLLNHLQLFFGDDIETPITPDTLAKMIVGGKKLKYLALSGRTTPKINRKEFEMLAKAAEYRTEQNMITIDIVGRNFTTQIQFPQFPK